MYISPSFLKTALRSLANTTTVPAAILLAVLVLLAPFTQIAASRPILKNEVEDLDILIPQFIGGAPDVLILMDLSGSMGTNFGGQQRGNWDISDILESCGSVGGSGASGRAISSHCAEMASNLTVCGPQSCETGFGTCEDVREIEALTECILDNNPAYTTTQVDALIPIICGSGTTTFAGCSSRERERLAAALEADAGLTQCSIPDNCQLGSDPDPSCDTSSDKSRFNTCMLTNNSPVVTNKPENCFVPGNPDCVGRFEFGSSRLDAALSVFFDLLDADNSLAGTNCSDPGMLYNGTTSVITCREYMETPFRDVQNIVGARGFPSSSRRMPSLDEGGGSAPTFLKSYLTDDDAELLGFRMRAMSYSGAGNWGGCDSNSTYQVDQGGFAGQSKLDLDRFWNFFRRESPSGGTPLAWAIGFDDDSIGSPKSKDMLNVFRVELQTDPSASCRPEFAIVITDGEDTCAGQCSGSCLRATTNANRRSSIQAVSNLRTHFTRNPITTNAAAPNLKKEILTFVIGLGLNTPEARRTIHAMALAGGTSTLGVIEHLDPNGNIVGTVEIDDPGLIPYPQTTFDVFKDFAEAKSLDTLPNSAHLKGCSSSERSDVGNCTFQSEVIFDDAFFANGAPFKPDNKEIENFAFIAANPEDLANALKSIFANVETFSTSGSSPSAPQSSTSVALRDRIFLSLVTPITSERMWQGRLGLFGFLDDPDNPGSKVVVANKNGTPAQRNIFDDDGSLNANAALHYWDAGQELAERDLTDITSPRRLFTVDTSDSATIITERDTDPEETLMTRKAIGPLLAFNTTNIQPIDLGITESDLTDPAYEDRIDTLCLEACPIDAGAVCDPAATSEAAIDACLICKKECIRDEIVGFLIGNTDILPAGDPLGPMGIDCPDPNIDVDEGEEEPGSFAKCTVRLGDIFHSTPKVVGSPSALFFDTGFQNFAINFRDRTGVVYVGANDGFLHAFHAGEFKELDPETPFTNPFTNEPITTSIFKQGTGEELFGFASPSFLPNSRGPINPPATNPTEHSTPDYRFGDFKSWILPEFTPERSWFDGSPLVADVWIDGESNGIPDVNDDFPCVSPTIGEPDGEIDACGKEWHTVLLTTPRNGGGIISALDVTNVNSTDSDLKKFDGGSAYPDHRWTLFDKNFGNVWGDPVIGRLRMNTAKAGEPIVVDRWVMFVGGGINPLVADAADLMNTGIEKDLGNAFYVIDMVTGKIIFKYARDAAAAPNATIVDPAMACDLPGTVSAIDLNSDGYIDLVYAGDRCGRLWRFDVSMPFFDAGNNVANTDMAGNPTLTSLDSGGDSVWTGSIAFCANKEVNCNPANSTAPYFPNVDREDGTDPVIKNLWPIFFAPTVVLDDGGNKHVIFLTGNRREPSNIEEQGKLVNFIDTYVPTFFNAGVPDTPPAVLDFGDFPDDLIVELIPDPAHPGQFTNTVGSAISNSGEFIVEFPNNLPGLTTPAPGGEKGFGSPVVIQSVLLWTTFAPVPVEDTDLCSAAATGGEGRIFGINYLTGEPSVAEIPGATNLLLGDDTSTVAGKTVAFGMPTPAQLSFGARGSVVMVVAFSGSAAVGSSQFLVWELPPFPSRTQTLFWEELF